LAIVVSLLEGREAGKKTVYHQYVYKKGICQ